jgi:hypothetical protein
MRSWRTSWRMTPCSSRASQLLARRTITSLVSDLSHPPEYVLPVVKPTAGLRTPQLATSIPSSAAVAAALADKDSDTPRTSFEQLALVESLQQEICKHGELVPAPSDSNDWPPTLLRRYFESGGLLTLEALNEQPDSAETRRLIDRVGDTLPAVPLDPLPELEECGGLLGALRAKDGAGRDAMASLCARLLRDHCVTCRLGAPDALYEALRHEGALVAPHMRPGEIRSSADGQHVSGRSPSGALRGDQHLRLREVLQPEEPSNWPALAAADEALGVVGSALAHRLRVLDAPGLQALGKRSDTFVATFPGDGLGCTPHAGIEREHGRRAQPIRSH